MMTFGAPTGVFSGGVCWCCRRHDDGIAYIHPTRNGPVWFWSCHDHIRLAKKAAHMPPRDETGKQIGDDPTWQGEQAAARTAQDQRAAESLQVRRDLAAQQEAMRRAGKKAGDYLDAIGKTDLATLTQIEWVTFLRLNLDTFGQSLADLIESHEVPF